MTNPAVSRFRQIDADRIDEFESKGFLRSNVFPHRIHYLPKCGPDAFKLATRFFDCSPEQMVEVVIYARPPLIDEFPADLFFDDDVIWHQQQFGRPGQVATANLIIRGDTIYTTAHVSDLVQRISRRSEHKTRIEKKLKGWHHMLLNAILNFARDVGARAVCTPGFDLAIENTDRARSPKRELFERVYDRDIRRLYKATMERGWWRIDLRENIDRIVIPAAGEEGLPAGRIIAVCHDVEHGYGHTSTDPEFAQIAHRDSPAFLDRILAIESEMGVRSTCNVLGRIFPELGRRIAAAGHCLGFHSFDHDAEETGPSRPYIRPASVVATVSESGAQSGIAGTPARRDQLSRCRDVDYRVKGYRPPQSKITVDLADERLLYHNFEWLASSAGSLGTRVPVMQRGLVKIPILFDDYALFRAGTSYEEWERQALGIVEGSEFVAFSLHDCYGGFWLPHYKEFLRKVSRAGTLRTLNEVAADLTLASAL